MSEDFAHDYDGGAFALFGTGYLVYLAAAEFLAAAIFALLYLPFALAGRRERARIAQSPRPALPRSARNLLI